MFIPKLYSYLQARMPGFRLKLNHGVTGLFFARSGSGTKAISALAFSNGRMSKHNAAAEHVFCPGEFSDCLHRLSLAQVLAAVLC